MGIEVGLAAIGSALGASAASATAVGALAAGAVGSTVLNTYTGMKQASAQRDATNQATANAQKTATAADEANNRANQKAPDSAALLSANIAGAKGGNGSTMLTGIGGIDPNMLNLGKNTLLGGGGT